MYSPAIGRFLQMDPLGYVDGLNLYAYVGNNPVNWVDPLGEATGAAGGLLGWIVGDLLTPDPTDAAWPKWAAYGVGAAIGFGGAYLWDMLADDPVPENLAETFPAENPDNTCPLFPHEPGIPDVWEPWIETFPPYVDIPWIETFPIDDEFDLMMSTENTSPFQDIAEQIAKGHARKHSRLEIDEVAELIEETIMNGEEKKLGNDRIAYYNDLTGRIVIVDPANPDGGTTFIPTRGRVYFDELKP